VATGGRFQNIKLNEFVQVDEPGTLALLFAAFAVAFRGRRKYACDPRWNQDSNERNTELG
jgi:hypothetical protein